MQPDELLQLYLELGFSCLPLHRPPMPHPDCVRPGKGPCLNGRVYRWENHQHHRAPLSTVRFWLRHGHNIGIVTGEISGIAVVDLDDDAAVEWARKTLPPTGYRVLTGKGEHWYYLHPGVPVRNRMRRFPGVDVRGDGGYVVAPPSVHASGVVYQLEGAWSGPLPCFPLEVFALEPLPAAAGPAPSSSRPGARGFGPERIADDPDPERKMRRVRGWLKSFPPAVKGQGGDMLTYTLACRLVIGFELSDTQALELMEEWNQNCPPGWPRGKLQAKIDNARKYGQQ